MTDILDELNKEPPFEGCHVFFALHLANYPLTEERTQLQDDLNNRLKWRPQGWDKSLSVVFEKDHTVLPIAVSDYFEKLLLEVFPEIAGCLKLFRPGATWDKKTTHLDFERYACSDSIMDSIATYISAMETTTSSLNISEGSDKKIRPDSLLSLARMIKRLVLFPYYEKHSISSDVLQEILVRAQFEEEFAQQIKPSSTSRLLDMKKTTKKLKKLKFSDNDKKTYSDLVKSIIQDVWPLVQKLENEYSKISTICKKMSFEVEHYIEESTFEKKTDWQLKAPVVPQHIRNEILRVKDVYCIGTVYNEFTVYLHQEADKESEEHVHSEIDSIKKRHNSHFEYSIEKVMKPPVALANQQFENGDVIRSPGSAADFRYGTLGSFVKGSDDNIYAITCAHVVSHPDNDLDVFVRERGVDFRLFANSSPDLTVCFGETPYSLIDIAALAIKPDVEQQYEPRLKDESGLHRPWNIWDEHDLDESDNNILYNNVYKYGGRSRLTRGIIVSADIELPPPALLAAAEQLPALDSYLIMIDELPGSDGNTGPFAYPGDSGSIVCKTRLVDNVRLLNHGDEARTTAISMIHCGELKLRIGGQGSDQTLSFKLKPGLRLLTDKSGVQFGPT